MKHTTDFYFNRDGQVEGPLSVDELQFLAGRGRLTTNDLVRQGKNGSWTKAKEIPGLFREQNYDSQNETADSYPAETNSLRTQWRPDSETDSETIKHSIGRELSDSFQSEDSQYNNDFRDASRRKFWIASAIVVLILSLLVLWWLFRGKEDGSSGGSGSETGIAIENSRENSKAKSKKKPLHRKSNQDKANEIKRSKKQTNSKETPQKPKHKTKTKDKTVQEQKVRPTNPSSSGNKKKKGNPFYQSGSSEYSIGGGQFFGAKAKGSNFVYVVDCSGSMQNGRLAKVKREILRSIHALLPKQKFHVIFFADRAFPMFYPKSIEKLLSARKSNLNRVNRWVKDFVETGGTDPEEAIKLALKMKPDAIFLLTDGEFPSGVTEIFRKNNQKNISIYTFGFQRSPGEAILRKIASENNGEFRYVR